MMLIFPLREELFASKAIPAIIHRLATGTRPELHDPLIHHAVQMLKAAAIVSNDLRLQAPVFGDSIVLNMRDRQVDLVLSSKHMRRVLSAIPSDHSIGLRELAATLDCNPGTVKRVLDKVRAAGLVKEGRLMENVIYRPTSQIDEVPRAEHRNMLNYFISFLKTEENLDAAIAYGDATIGKQTQRIEVLFVSKLITPTPPDLESDIGLVKKAAQAANDAAAAYKPLLLELALVESFEWQSYLLASKPFLSTRLYRASQGVTIHGDSRPNLAKLVEQWMMMSPMSQDELARAIERNMLVKTATGFEATPTLVEAVAKASTKASEDIITVNLVGGGVMTIPRIRLVRGKDLRGH